MQEFLQALKINDTKNIMSAIAADKSVVNHVFEELDKTPFALALEYGFTNLAQTLLQVEGLDIDNPAHNPLTLSVEFGFVELAASILDKGANPNIRHAGNSAILLALENGYFDLAQKLVDCGAEVNVRNDKGWTPLIWAALKGRTPMVEFLLKNNASVNACNDDGWNAITAAYFKNRIDIVELLKQHGASLSEKFAEAALLSAYNNGQTEVVKLLIAEGISPEVEDANGQTVFLKAIENTDTNIVKLCLEAGANPNAKYKGVPAIYTLARNGQLELIKLLLEYDVNVNATTGGNFTALYIAADMNNVEVADCLIKHGANINARCGKKEYSPLIIATYRYNFKILQLLLSNGVNRCQMNSDNEMAWTIAESIYNKNGYSKLNETLLNLLKPK